MGVVWCLFNAYGPTWIRSVTTRKQAAFEVLHAAIDGCLLPPRPPIEASYREELLNLLSFGTLPVADLAH